jgi:hypothetical protein
MKTPISTYSVSKYLFGGGFVILVWMAAIWISAIAVHPLNQVNLSDLAAVLFGAASVALFVFSIVLAGLAVFGWQFIEGKIEDRVEKATRAANERLEIELRGRVYSVMGFMLGSMSLKSGSVEGSKEILDKDRLEQGIDQSRRGLDLLKKIGGAAEFMALNNLVFFSSVLGEGVQKDYLLKSARRLKEAAEEQEAPTLLLTFCFVVLKYSSDAAELRQAYEIAESVKDRKDLSEAQRKEARFYLASLPQRIKVLSSEATTGIRPI